LSWRYFYTFPRRHSALYDDLAGLLRTLWEEVQSDAEALALGRSNEVGPRRNYPSHALAGIRAWAVTRHPD
jgi:hypothetical protein